MSPAKKVGRPKSAAPARDQINVRLREGERAKLVQAAERDRRTLSDWARLALLDAAEK